GMGIPINQQQRIFERFDHVDAARTGAPKRRGTGLGLAIVKNAVTALEGSIRVESVWKQGTTMIVELPVSVKTTTRA
ncbi:MAG: ATP-binding protein, partial [Phycisphaerae bacterium]